MSIASSRRRSWAALIVAACGVVAAALLPFAPVTVNRTIATWPVPGHPAVSSTALFAPDRPTSLTAVLPCAALRPDPATPHTVLATGTRGEGLVVTADASGAWVRSDGRSQKLPEFLDRPGCRVTISADATGMSVVGPAGLLTRWDGQPVPRVLGFRTGLDSARTAGMSVTAETISPFGTSPTPAKLALIATQCAAGCVALCLLAGRRPRWFRRIRWPRLWWVDAAVIAVLGGWAVIGPLAVDDGWAATIARNFAATGSPGNYYRWWNASEVPFALSEELLSGLTEISSAPLWLRMPSTVLGVATWFVVSRGVLGAALPRRSDEVRIRLLAALLMLAAWLPFNLGTRPEPYVALSVTAVLAFVWRGRTSFALGWAALAAGLTLAVSPTGVIVVAPLAAFAPRMVRMVRAGVSGRLEVIARVGLLCCVAAVGLTAVFADETWSALRTATEWHTTFGPALPWYHEPDRYFYLLSGDQQGSAPKRLPVLLSVAMVIVMSPLAFTRRTTLESAALRLGAVVVLALVALAVVPSKWSYHLGGVAGLFASFLTVAVVLVAQRVRLSTGGRLALGGACAASAVVASAAALAFAGPNAWWQSTVYDIPWAAGPIRPGGLPLDNPLIWIGLGITVAAAYAGICSLPPVRAVLAAPPVVTVFAAVTAVAVLLGSFIAAPTRRASGSLAVANVSRLISTRACALADDIQVLPDGPPLAIAEAGDSRSAGFSRLSGYPAGAPPPDLPGSGTSAQLWGSFGAQGIATVTTPWFVQPPLGPNDGVAVSVSGRVDRGNSMVFEFGRAADGDVRLLGASAPVDRVAIDEDPARPLWRSIGIDAAQIPPGADRIRIKAVDDRNDAFGWLAVTGPRLRSAVGLNEFLADHGPVLISWPQAFLFPCVHDIPQVRDGLAQTPRTVIESPRPFFTEDRDPSIGGTFSGVVASGDLHEVPSRLVGHPEIDWGTVLTSSADVGRDAYARTVIREVRWGFDESGRIPAVG